MSDWEEVAAAEAEMFHRLDAAIAEVVAAARDLLTMGGDIDGDGVEYALSQALDRAYPQRIEQRAERRDQPKRKGLPRPLVTRVMERDAYRCVHCGTHVDLTIDHVLAVANGGTDDEDNLQTLCRPCNSRKGTR